MTKLYTVFCDEKGVFHYINEHGYEHCNHADKVEIEVVTAYGNRSFICHWCGNVIRKELTPTSL